MKNNRDETRSRNLDTLAVRGDKKEESKSFRLDDSENEDIDWGNPSSNRDPASRENERRSSNSNARSLPREESKNSDNIHDM